MKELPPLCTARSVATPEKYSSPILLTSTPPNMYSEETRNDFQERSVVATSPRETVTPFTLKLRDMFSHCVLVVLDHGDEAISRFRLLTRALGFVILRAF